MNAASVVAEYVAQCHGCNSAATDCDCRDERAGDCGRLAVGEGTARVARSTASVAPARVAAAGMSSEDSEAGIARERRNARSLARVPNVANASAHSARASTCGHSSSHLSPAPPVRSRRSCATIASCHARSRTRSDSASEVPTPAPSAAYGFMSVPSFPGTPTRRLPEFCFPPCQPPQRTIHSCPPTALPENEHAPERPECSAVCVRVTKRCLLRCWRRLRSLRPVECRSLPVAGRTGGVGAARQLREPR